MFQASMKVHTRGCLEVLGYQVHHLETALFLWLLALWFKIFGYHLNVSIVWKPTPATQSSQIFSVCVISSEFQSYLRSVCNLIWVSILFLSDFQSAISSELKSDNIDNYMKELIWICDFDNVYACISDNIYYIHTPVYIYTSVTIFMYSSELVKVLDATHHLNII